MPSFLYVSQAGQRDDDGFNVIFDYWWFGCGLLVSFFLSHPPPFALLVRAVRHWVLSVWLLVALQFGVRERSSCVRRCVRYMGFNATISDHRYCTSDDQTFETGDGGAHAGPCARAGVHESRVELSLSMCDAPPRVRGTRRLDIPGCSNCGPPGPRDPG